jgi:hypothetical protein
MFHGRTMLQVGATRIEDDDADDDDDNDDDDK